MSCARRKGSCAKVAGGHVRASSRVGPTRRRRLMCGPEDAREARDRLMQNSCNYIHLKSGAGLSGHGATGTGEPSSSFGVRRGTGADARDAGSRIVKRDGKIADAVSRHARCATPARPVPSRHERERRGVTVRSRTPCPDSLPSPTGCRRRALQHDTARNLDQLHVEAGHRREHDLEPLARLPSPLSAHQDGLELRQ